MKEHIYLKSKIDGLRLGVLMYSPEQGTRRGIIQFAHGMCGCKERFKPAMKYLSEMGYICIANDHRGHGESIIRREDLGYMYDGGWNALIEDMKSISDYAKSRFPGMKLFLVGHSMGSLASRIYASRYGQELAGMFLCGSPAKSPFAAIGRNLSELMCVTGLGHHRPALMQKISSSSFNRQFKEEGWQAWTCSDKSTRDAFAGNPICNFTFTANGSMNLLRMLKEAYDSNKTHSCNPKLPVILMNGEDDPCSKGQEGMKEAVAQTSTAGYTNITALCYPKMRHELLNETDYIRVLDDISRIIGKITSTKEHNNASCRA